MKTHIDATHAHLVGKRKLKLIVIVATKHLETNHSWQPWKKKATLSMFVITMFFGSTNPYKHRDEAQQWFLEDLVLYICKGYKLLLTCKKHLAIKARSSSMSSC